MLAAQNSAYVAAAPRPASALGLRTSATFCGSVAVVSLVAAFLLPKGYTLALIGDGLQMVLVAAASYFALRNASRSHSHVRGFWLLISLGMAMWLVSLVL